MNAVPAEITEDDRSLIKPYVILPLVQAAFERDSRVFLTLRTPDPYVDWLNAARERLSNEAKAVRAQAHRRGVKITEQQRVNGTLLVRYQCRGYFGDMALEDAEIAEEAAGFMRRLLAFENAEV
ncbi:hypothetical protein [Paenibacillus sp. sgz5001063]|uniref:hypothetical protein n=1 Tax=Paenibacillus sp. sgz5001063 TaxID=3242474 RepID=UPI0036D3A9FA